LGAGAEFQSLTGGVDRDSFQRVLEGRHPHSGARLVTARGSSQRRHLATGTAARYDEQGDALYEVADVARLLKLRRRDVEAMIVAEQGADDDLGWIATVDSDDGRLVPDREISRHLDVAARPVDPDGVRAGGEPDELLTVRQVAQLLHVTPRYVQRLCAAHHAEGSDRRRTSIPNVRVGDGALIRYLVRRADVAALAETRTVPVARVGFDLTLTCEKSLGLLSLLADPARQARLLRVLQVANDTAIAHLDRVASVARRRGATVHTEGLVVASYFHATSRALDPHPHHHNVVANAVVDDHGDVRTLDARALYRHAPAAAALATAAARWELRDLGVGWWRRDDGVWEIAGIDEAAIREFSRRRNEMDEVRAALEERLGRRITHDEETTVALRTRAGKEAVDPEALLDEWRRRAAAVGLDVEACFGRPDRALAFEVLPDDHVAQLFDDLADARSGLCSEATTFDRGDVVAAIADWSLRDKAGRAGKVLLPPAEIERVADRFCASNLVVELDPVTVGGVIRRRDGTVVADGQHEPTYATVELLHVEDEILRRWQSADRGGAIVPEPLLAAALTSDEVTLNDEQQALVHAWCTSGRRAQCAIGRAGSGKTTTMRAAARAWRNAATGSSAVRSRARPPDNSPPTPPSTPTPSPCC
jgi:conjugative relaxase-like TrwC/TraI family protein